MTAQGQLFPDGSEDHLVAEGRMQDDAKDVGGFARLD